MNSSSLEKNATLTWRATIVAREKDQIPIKGEYKGRLGEDRSFHHQQTSISKTLQWYRQSQAYIQSLYRLICSTMLGQYNDTVYNIIQDQTVIDVTRYEKKSSNPCIQVKDQHQKKRFLEEAVERGTECPKNSINISFSITDIFSLVKQELSKCILAEQKQTFYLMCVHKLFCFFF